MSYEKKIPAFLAFALLSVSLLDASPQLNDNGPIYWGALISGSTYGVGSAPQDMRSVAAFEAHTGKKVSIIHFGQTWYSNGTPLGFPTTSFDNVRYHGSIPLFSWSSRDDHVSNEPNFRSSVVTSGIYDSYIRQFANDAKAWGHPFFLRFDWEMNGWWYPWAEGKQGAGTAIYNGNNPGDYVAMWKHVHDIFTQVGAANVTWVWCINEMTNTSAGQHPPVAQIYPGDNYVDWTGMDNYNRYAGWESFNTMITGSGTNWISNTYQSLLDIAASKPIMLAEFGSKEDSTDGQRKANWLTDALTVQLPGNFPQIKAAVYFNWNTTTDPADPDSSIVIESSAAAQTAFATGIASSYYTANTFASLPPGPIQPPTSLSTNLLFVPLFMK
jgi:mannan endo-1,4-beta-mannosidase